MRAWPSASRHHPSARQRDAALLRPKRAARWVAGLATAAAAVITGVVAHQLPGAASRPAPGSSSSGTSGTSGASGSTSSAGTGSGSSSSGQTPTVAPSTQTPTVVSGGSGVR